MPSALEQAFAYCLDKWVSKDSRRSYRFQQDEGRLFIWDNEKRLMQEFSASDNTCGTVLDLSNPAEIRDGLPLPPVPVHELKQSQLVFIAHRVEPSKVEAFTFIISEEGGIVGSSVRGLEGIDGIAQDHIRIRFDSGAFQARKCSNGLVAFADSCELDDEWYTLHVPKGTIHLGKGLKLAYEEKKISVIAVQAESSSDKGNFVDRSEILREKKRRKGLHGYEEGLAKSRNVVDDDNDIFESISCSKRKGLSKQGIGHEFASHSSIQQL